MVNPKTYSDKVLNIGLYLADKLANTPQESVMFSKVLDDSITGKFLDFSSFDSLILSLETADAFEKDAPMKEKAMVAFDVIVGVAKKVKRDDEFINSLIMKSGDPKAQEKFFSHLMEMYKYAASQNKDAANEYFQSMSNEKKEAPVEMEKSEKINIELGKLPFDPNYLFSLIKINSLTEYQTAINSLPIPDSIAHDDYFETYIMNSKMSPIEFIEGLKKVVSLIAYYTAQNHVNLKAQLGSSQFNKVYNWLKQYLLIIRRRKTEIEQKGQSKIYKTL